MGKYKIILNGYIVVVSFGVSIYMGLFSENEGFNNIGMTILWTMAILLLSAIFTKEKKEKQKIQYAKYHRLALKTTCWALSLMMIYKGSIVLGLIYVFIFAFFHHDNKRVTDEHTTI